MIPYRDIRKAREEIKEVLGISARSQWYQRLNGNIIPNVEEKDAIEKIFAKYKVKNLTFGGGIAINAEAKLTRRETQVGKLLAWGGACKKNSSRSIIYIGAYG